MCQKVCHVYSIAYIYNLGNLLELLPEMFYRVSLIICQIPFFVLHYMGFPHSDLRKIDSHLSDTISRIIENKNLLYQIHDCCTAEYNNADFEISYEDFFLNKKGKPLCLHRKWNNLT